MLADLPQTLGTALALLVLGFLVGRLWSLRRGPADRGSPDVDRSHFMQGMNHLVSSQPDLAIHELSQAVRMETDSVEAYLALGNLFREKGQTERAIDIHKSLLHRSGLSKTERTQVLHSLGQDFKKAGLLRRAERTLREVLERDRGNVACVHTLRELLVETGRWAEAVELQRQLEATGDVVAPPTTAALEFEWGRAHQHRDEVGAAEGHFRASLEEDESYAPAHLGLAECLLQRSDDAAGARHLERAAAGGGPWAAAALPLLADACARLDDPGRLARACERVLATDPGSWRAHYELGCLLLQQGDLDGAGARISEALETRPSSVAAQRALWRIVVEEGGGVEGQDRVSDEVARRMRDTDPFLCIQCGYTSAVPFVRCPHCHRWETVAEERF